MTETVIVALIGAAQAVLIAIAVPLLRRQETRMKQIAADAQATRRDARVAATQTENNHIGLNLRDDLDEHRGMLATLMAQVKDVAGAVVGFRKDMRQLRDVDLEHTKALTAVSAALTEARTEITALDHKLDGHLDWSRRYVADQDKGKKES